MRQPKRALPLRAIVKVAATAALSLALLVPAAAQFWPFGGGQQRQQQAPQPQRQQQQQQYNPFGGWFGSSPEQQRQQQAPSDSSRAPNPARRSAESTAAITTPIVVMGDAMADWLAYGLEDALADKPEFGIVRKHRTVSGLIRYDPRRDVEWAQVVREIIAADKPKVIVMMVGYHDRQPIRERAPTAAPAGTSSPGSSDPEDPESPESRAKASAEAANAEMQKAAQQKAAAQQPQAAPVPTGPMEFHSESWQAAYIKRIDATIAALRSANVPVFWVGLPPQRNTRLAQDAVYLNELFRTRAERAGITYVDVWDGFVDEAGRYVLQGPDVDGQTRRLRSGDTIYFTKAGARKLAHYVEREIQRNMVNRAQPFALPAPEPAVLTRPGASRPVAGPVIPLTTAGGGGNELLGGGVTRPQSVDPVANKVLVRGEPIAAPAGRADNFVWPLGGAPTAQPETPAEAASVAPEAPPAAAPVAAPGPPPAAAQPKRAPAPRAKAESAPAEPKQPVQRRAPAQQNPNAPRPPMPISPSASAPQGGFWR